MFKKVLWAAAAALLLVAVSGNGLAVDQIFLAKGAPSRGNITAMSKDTVTLDMSGVARPFQVNEISRITFDEEPSELTNARNAVIQKNWGVAKSELDKPGAAEATRDLIKQDIDFYKALATAKLAMTEGGDKNAAATAMLNFAKSAPNNYHFYEAAEVLGDLAVASGKFADAARFYGSIAASAPWEDYKLRANNAVGRALIAEKKFPEALEKFNAVLASELTTPLANEQKLFATIGKAQCMAEAGQAEEGIAMLQDVIAKNDATDATLFARTYNALGNCYLKVNKPKDALQAFLHTDILFYADADGHAEALYHLSKLWSDVNKADRAVAARNTLRERYPGTIWNTLE
jgi:tetratricopeptide (TPR) repeat protein